MLDALAALGADPVSEGTLLRAGRRVRWYAAGRGPASVVLEPGAGDPAAVWLPIVRAIADRARIVLYDRAGFGGTDPVGRPSIGAALADLRAVLAHAAEGGPCILVGHSWGGLLAQMAALAHPELIDGMVLVDPAHEHLWLDLPGDELARAVEQADQDTDLDRYAAEHAQTARTVAHATTDDPGLADLVERAYLAYGASPQQSRALASEQFLAVANLDELTRRRASAPPSSIRAVVLTAMGRPEPWRRSVYEGHRLLVQSMPAGRHEVVYDAGHLLHLDRPRRVIDAVDEILQRV